MQGVKNENDGHENNPGVHLRVLNHKGNDKT